MILNSPAGRQERRDRMVEQIRKQEGECECGNKLTFSEARFERNGFLAGEENKVICGECLKAL